MSPTCGTSDTGGPSLTSHVCIGAKDARYTIVTWKRWSEKRGADGGLSFVGFGTQVAITFTMSWYLLHKRELKRFYQKEDAEKKEAKAMTKEIEVTNVLSLQ